MLYKDYLKNIGYENFIQKEREDNPHDLRYQENQDGVIEAEYWNLDITLAALIYPRLKYWQEHVRTTDKENVKNVNKVIKSLEYILSDDYFSANRPKWVQDGLDTLAEIWTSLWC